MPSASDRQWVTDAVRRIQGDAHRSADTHLVRVPLPEPHTVDLYLKDESTHPTGSLKHRLARSLFLYGLVDGQIRSGTTIVEASSGSTAVSEAYYARMLGLPFVAVMASTTSPEKIALIERTGGTCPLVDDPTSVYAVAQQLADERGGVYLDQFTNAERATDWRGNNNIAESIFEQLAHEPHPLPHWVVVGAGTGGTSATIGRFIRYQGNAITRLCVVDPEGSAFYPEWAGEEPGNLHGSRIEGIGRPRVEPSFRPDVIEEMIRVPDAASVAAMQLLRDRTGIQGGPSTGTNIYGVLQLACAMAARGERGSIVSLVCDRSDRYEATHCSSNWLSEHDLDPAPYAAHVAEAWDSATWHTP